MNSRTELAELFEAETIVSSHECLPRQRRMLSRLKAEGAIVRLLPGIYAPAALADDLRVRCAAVLKWDPDAVISGLMAAHLTFWPKARPDRVEACTLRKRGGPPWLSLRRSRVPAEHVAARAGLRVTNAAWTAIDRAASDHGEAIDNALREGVVTLPDLSETLADHCGRHGNGPRRSVVRDSRGKPWSQGERWLHRELRSAGIKGWVANHWVELSGEKFSLDVAFRGLRLVIEFDGRWVHNDPEAFERDRHRHNVLVAEGGWTILRVTWGMLTDPRRLIRLIKLALRRLRAAASRRR